MGKASLALCSTIGMALCVGFSGCTIKTETNNGTGGSSGGGGSTATGGSAGSSGTPATGGGGSAGLGGSTGGSAGTSGASPGDGAVIVIEAGSDPCTSADPGNNDRDHTTAYPLNAEFRACLQTADDIDFYEFTTPVSPAGGGVVVINLTDVGTNGGVDSTSYATSDNGEIQNGYSTNGTSVFYWFAAPASTRYRVSVKAFAQSTMANPYTFKGTYVAVDDAYEPNDTRATAKTIALGTAVHGFMFAGFATSTVPGDASWEDWFKVTLAAGSATFTLADLPNDLTGTFSLYDSTGVIIGTTNGSNDGSTVLDTRTGLTAGDYTLKVTPYFHPNPRNSGSLPPPYATQAYSLTVAQP